MVGQRNIGTSINVNYGQIIVNLLFLY